jgi:hypothetical protein
MSRFRSDRPKEGPWRAFWFSGGKTAIFTADFTIGTLFVVFRIPEKYAPSCDGGSWGCPGVGSIPGY